MKRWINGSLIGGTLLAAAATGFWFGRDTRPGAAASQPSSVADVDPIATVRTQPLTSGSIAQTIDAYGTIQPTPGTASSVSVPVEVRIERALVAVGARVDAGSAVVEVGPTPDAELLMQQAKDALAAADRNLASARSRLSEQLATNAEVATAEQAARSAKTQLDGLTSRGIDAHRQLKTDTAGIVTQVNVQPGQLAPAGTALVQVNPQDRNEALLGVEPTEVEHLHVGDAVSLADVHAADDATPVVGAIRMIAAQVDPQSRLRNVSVTLPGDATLAQGTFIVGHLTAATATGLLAPRAAVTPDDDDQIVFVIRNGKAARIVVKTGLTNREQVQILGDALHDGDAVVVAGNAELEDGMAVQIAQATTEAATEPATAEAK